jgi:hypothetical protein
MRRKLALLAGALGGLALLALALNLVNHTPAPPPPAEPGSGYLATPGAVPPWLAEPELLDPTRERLLAQAEALASKVIQNDDLHPVLAKWRGHYAPHASFRFDGLDNRRWITVTSARVDCAYVDEVLRRNADLGNADNCARWAEKAREVMERFGIKDRSPTRFLEELGAEQSMRVLLVYAGWQRSGDGPDDVRLVASEPVLVYPQSEFPERDYAALDRIYRAMKLGPHAEDRAVASLE